MAAKRQRGRRHWNLKICAVLEAAGLPEEVDHLLVQYALPTWAKAFHDKFGNLPAKFQGRRASKVFHDRLDKHIEDRYLWTYFSRGGGLTPFSMELMLPLVQKMACFTYRNRQGMITEMYEKKVVRASRERAVIAEVMHDKSESEFTIVYGGVLRVDLEVMVRRPNPNYRELRPGECFRCGSIRLDPNNWYCCGE